MSVELKKKSLYTYMRPVIISFKTELGDEYSNRYYEIEIRDAFFDDYNTKYIRATRKNSEDQYPVTIWVKLKDAVEIRTKEEEYDLEKEYGI